MITSTSGRAESTTVAIIENETCAAPLGGVPLLWPPRRPLFDTIATPLGNRMREGRARGRVREDGLLQPESAAAFMVEKHRVHSTDSVSVAFRKGGGGMF